MLLTSKFAAGRIRFPPGLNRVKHTNNQIPKYVSTKREKFNFSSHQWIPEIIVYLLRNCAAAFCVRVNILSNDFSKKIDLNTAKTP